MGNDYMEAIRKQLKDDIRNDVGKEMIMAGDELLAARRQAIREGLEEQRKVVREVVEEAKKAVWAGLEDLRDSISNYSLNKREEVNDSNAGIKLEEGSIVIHNSK